MPLMIYPMSLYDIFSNIFAALGVKLLKVSHLVSPLVIIVAFRDKMRESNISLRETIAESCTVPIKSMALDLNDRPPAGKNAFWGKKTNKNIPRVKHLEIMFKISEQTKYSSFSTYGKLSNTTLSPSKTEQNSPAKRSHLKNPMYQNKPLREPSSAITLKDPKPNNYKLFPKR